MTGAPVQSPGQGRVTADDLSGIYTALAELSVLRGTLSRLMEQRYPVYAEADYTVVSGDGPHDIVVDQILAVLPESYRQLDGAAPRGD